MKEVKRIILKILKKKNYSDSIGNFKDNFVEGIKKITKIFQEGILMKMNF